jgi:hypothetical protein
LDPNVYYKKHFDLERMLRLTRGMNRLLAGQSPLADAGVYDGGLVNTHEVTQIQF